MFKFILVGLVTFGSIGASLPVQAQLTPSEKTLIAQENLIVSTYAWRLVKLYEYMDKDPDKYLVEAQKLIKSWDAMTPSFYGVGTGLDYIHRAVYAHRSILRFGAIKSLTPELFEALYNESIQNLEAYLATPLPSN